MYNQLMSNRNVNTISFSELAEQENIEFKTCSGGRLPEDFWQVVTAFSNLEGGIVYLGVKPDGSHSGLSVDDIDRLQRSVQSNSKNAYNHDLYPQISVKGDVVAVYYPEVPAALKIIHAIRQGAYAGARVRVGASNEHISAEWIQRFAMAAQGGAELVPHRYDWRKTLEDDSINQYINDIREQRGHDIFQDLSMEEVLRKLRAIDEEGNITTFGLLAFGKNSTPQDIIGPTASIAVTTYAGLDKVDPLDATVTSVEDKEFYGNSGQLFSESFPHILKKIPRRNRIEENGRRASYPAVPDVAIREALANTIVHRDYASTSSKIQVDIYSDRVEFINPGRSLIPLHELDAAHSETRNPILMNYMKEIGVTEQRARGIRTIKTSLRRAGLLEPEFLHRGNAFVAILYSSAALADSDAAWLRRFDAFRLSDRQKNALVHVKTTSEAISNSKYREINHMRNVGDDVRARIELQNMAKVGLLEPMGANKSRKYKLGPVAIL